MSSKSSCFSSFVHDRNFWCEQHKELKKARVSISHLHFTKDYSLIFILQKFCAKIRRFTYFFIIFKCYHLPMPLNITVFNRWSLNNNKWSLSKHQIYFAYCIEAVHSKNKVNFLFLNAQSLRSKVNNLCVLFQLLLNRLQQFGCQYLAASIRQICEERCLLHICGLR